MNEFSLPRKKIMHVVPSIDNSGGIENYINSLCQGNHLTEFEVMLCSVSSKFNIDVYHKLLNRNLKVVFLKSTLYEKIKYKPLKYLLKYSFVAYIKKLHSLNKVIFKYQPDILIAHGEDAELISSFTGKTPPTINVIHGEIFFPICFYYRFILVHYSRKKYSHTIVVNKDLITKSKLSPTVSSVVHAGIDINKFKVKPTSFVEGQKVHIGYLGRLTHEKGIINLIKAFISLAKDDPTVILEIAGDGKLYSYIKNKIPPEMIGRINLWGKVIEIEKFFNKIEIVVIPSFSEGGPLVLLEAMAAGKIIVTTNVGIVSDVIKNSINGFILANNKPSTISETLKSILKEQICFKEISKNAHNDVIPFSLDSMINNFNKVINLSFSKYYH